MPYGNNPSGNNRDAIRLLVGDTSTSTGGEFLTNTDYDFFIAQTASIWIAAQLAANSIAAQFMGLTGGSAGYTQKSVGDLSLTRAQAQEMASSYTALSRKFSRMAAAKIQPSAGGVVDGSGNLIMPFFKRQLFDSPESVTPISSTGVNLSSVLSS